MIITAETIATALRGHKSARGWICFCPAHDDRSRSLSIRDGDRSPLVHCFAGCDGRDVISGLRGMGLWFGKRQPYQPPPKKTADDSDERMTRLAMCVWRDAIDPRGTPVETYLGNRGLPLPDDIAGAVIRFLPRCYFGDKQQPGGGFRLPAMIALMRDIVTDRPIAIHRTALTLRGHKAEMPDDGKPKRMLGPTRNAAVKLSPAAEVIGGLGICEGIETGLAIISKDWKPVWAIGSAEPLAKFPLLPGIEALTVFADHDVNGTGRKKALECAATWRDAGRDVTVYMPKRLGDWADEVLR